MEYIGREGKLTARTVTEQSLRERLARCSEWPAKFLPEQWETYRAVIRGARERSIPFAVGGGLAAMTYADQWRNTKDLDIYTLQEHCDSLVQLMAELGLSDYYDVQPYDRKWIYRAHNGEVIIDVIWAMANQRARVDENWLHGPEVEVGGERIRLLAPEEAIWSKLYVLQRDRTDWPDCLNVLYGIGPQLDWTRLIGNVGDDLPLLSGLISVFAWLAPQRARELPESVWEKLHLSRPEPGLGADVMRQRAAFLDSRPWFTPCKAEDERAEG